MTSHDVTGLGLLEDNDIYGNTLSGVWIKTDANPVLKRNKIYDGKESGVCVFSNGRGVLEENEVFNNLLSGKCIMMLVIIEHPLIHWLPVTSWTINLLVQPVQNVQM